MGKWQKIDPDQIKVGDRVRVKTINQPDAYDFTVFERGATWIGVFATVNHREWYIRKPKKAKPEPDLVEGHDAKFWFGRWEKQLNHNEQLQAVNSGRRVKMQRLEKEVNDARKYAQYWQDKYAVLAASINEVPDEPTPPTRPDEPPVGSFFRVDRRPLVTYRRVDNGLNGYICVTTPSSWLNWNNIVDLGDTIKMLELREVGK